MSYAPASPSPKGRGALALVLLLFMILSGALSCARDCSALVERRCRLLGEESEGCEALRARAATVPHQSCEAVLNALDLQNAAR